MQMTDKVFCLQTRVRLAGATQETGIIKGYFEGIVGFVILRLSNVFIMEFLVNINTSFMAMETTNFTILSLNYKIH